MNMLFGAFKTHVKVKWDWYMKKFEARMKPTTLWGGLVRMRCV